MPPDDHKHAGNVYERHSVWDSKDTVPRELAFLQPLNASRDQVARVMVGPRRIINLSDGSAQTAAANSAASIIFTANDITANTWSTPPAGAGVLFENFRATIASNDTSAKLQITIPLRLAVTGSMYAPLAMYPTPLPFTFPAINQCSYTISALTPMPVWLPSDPPLANGPQAILGVVNTDGAASHPYVRAISYAYRLVYDIDYSKEKVYVMGTLI